VRAVSPAIYQTVLLSANGNARGIVLKGVDPDLERRSNEALRRVTSGTMDFAPDAEGIQAILLGRSLADEFHIDVGDYITLIGPEGHLTPFGMVAHPRRFHVTGIFESGFYDYDENWSFITLEAAQQMAGIGDLANVLEFRIEQLDRAPELAQTLVRGAGLGFAATTWMEQNRALFRALRLEKLVTAIFIGLITFVAGLNILVVLAMTVTDKARDVAVLMTMGARRAQIRRIFVLQGLTLGGVGTFSGLIIGYGLAWWAGAYHVIPLDPQVYAVPYVPFHANAFDALWIAAVSLAISFAATFLPARAAARVLPVEILRFE
jgi:lipoprotein-releasing system permease protein